MIDIAIETLRAFVVGGILFSLIRARHVKEISGVDGWWLITCGFGLIFFGTLIDITDNFNGLNQFIIIGDTQIQAILEKIFGYLLGFVLLAFGIWRWLPKLIEHEEWGRKKIEVNEERLKVMHATMRTVHHIVNNFLNSLQLFCNEAENSNALEPESLEMLHDMIHDTASKLRAISDLDSTPEKEMASGIGIDYEQISKQETE